MPVVCGLEVEMRRLVCCSLCLAVLVSGWGMSAARAQTTKDDYQDRLRREIAERARELRDIRSGDQTRRTRRTLPDRRRADDYSPDRAGMPGVDLSNPFGTGQDFAAQAWENTKQGQYNLFDSKRDGKQKDRNAITPALDLHGRPMTSLQPGGVAPAVRDTAPPPTQEEKRAKQEEAAAALREATDRTMTAAQALIDNGEFGAARQMLIPLTVSRRRTAEEIEAAQQRIGQIDAEGMKRLEAADEAAGAGDPDKAATAYMEIQEAFGTAPAATLAQAKLAVLRAKPEVAAKFLYDRAMAYLQRKRADVAAPMLRDVVLKYGRTEYAAKAAEQLDRLEQEGIARDDGLSADEVLRARKHLIIGDIHALNGRVDQAVQSYQVVIQDFEDSRFAQTARARITELTQ